MRLESPDSSMGLFNEQVSPGKVGALRLLATLRGLIQSKSQNQNSILRLAAFPGAVKRWESPSRAGKGTKR